MPCLVDNPGWLALIFSKANKGGEYLGERGDEGRDWEKLGGMYERRTKTMKKCKNTGSSISKINTLKYI